MKVKMIQLLNFNSGVEKLKGQTLKIQVLYKLSKIADIVAEETKFYQEQMNEILNKYGKRNEAGEFEMNENKTMVLIKDGEQDNCNKELMDLYNIEVEVNDNYLLTIDDLGDIELTPEEFNSFKIFIQ